MELFQLQNTGAAPSVPEDVWQKNGIMRKVCSDAITAGEGLAETLDEVVRPKPMQFYDYVGIEDFIAVDGDKVLVRLYGSFLQKKKRVAFTVHLQNKRTGAYLGAVSLQPVSDTNRAACEAAIPVGDVDPRELAAVAEAEIVSENASDTLYICERECVVSVVKLDPHYEHIYPKKEERTVVFGDNPASVLPVSFVSDAGHIVISLYRAPEQSGDSDYVCNYRHGATGHAILGIPAKGIVNLGRSVTITQQLLEPFAKIEQMDAGGMSYVAQADHFLTPIINNGKIQYEIKTNWACEIIQEGNLKPYYYHYKLSFGLEYQLNAGATQRMKFTVSSQSGRGLTYNGSELTYGILPLKIMWGCLAEGTPVLTCEGVRAIETIRIGDRVVCAATGKATVVRNVWRGTEEQLIRLTYGGRTLLATPTHPIAVMSGDAAGFKRAADIKAGDVVQCIGGLTTVDAVQKEPYEGNVYNLSLEGDAHCFYAADAVVGDYEKENEEI